MLRSLAALSGVLGVLAFVVTVIIGGLQFPVYSHLSQYISETYAAGTPWGGPLRYYGFIPSGLLIALFAFLAMRSVPRSGKATIGFTGLAVFYGLGTIVCSVFVCDEGCGRGKTGLSPSQMIHNSMGFLTYVIVPVCLLLLGAAARGWKSGQGCHRTGLICGAIAVVFAGLFLSDPGSAYAGLWQRVAEGSVLTWIVVCSLYLHKVHLL